MDEHDIEVPHYFICPISLQIMKDPVTATTGITYDRDSIEHWLFKDNNTTCPVTNQPLPPDSDLTPNHTLRRLIQSWCTQNASSGIDRIPTPRPALDKVRVLDLLKDLRVPKLQLQTLKQLEVFAVERERNRHFMAEAGVMKSVANFVITCYKKGETTGIEEALSIFCLLRNLPTESKVVLTENDDIIEAIIWVLWQEIDNEAAVKSHAMIVLKTIVTNGGSMILERLQPEFFERIVAVLRKRMISCDGIKAALRVILDTCPWGRNRAMMVEAGVVFELVELELGVSVSPPEKKTTELILGVLFRLCSGADGRAQLLSHAGGLAMIANSLLKISLAADDLAVMILSLICKYSGTPVVLQEMLTVGAVWKLFMVLQLDRDANLKHKAKEILRANSEVWSPCINDVSTLLSWNCG